MRNLAVVVVLALGIATAASCGGGGKGRDTTEGNRGGQGTSVAAIPTQGGQPETQTGPTAKTRRSTTTASSGNCY